MCSTTVLYDELILCNSEKQLELIYKKDMTVFECNTCNKCSISTSAYTLFSSCNREKQLNQVNLRKDVMLTQKAAKL